MRQLMKNLTLIFAAGCLGGVFNGLAVWGFGVAGITAAAGVELAPPLTPAWLYPRVVWGGIWGVLFILPVLRGRDVSRGVLFSFAPTLVQLLVIMPRAGKGLCGLELGIWTPAFVLFFNMVWGLTAAMWLKILQPPQPAKTPAGD